MWSYTIYLFNSGKLYRLPDDFIYVECRMALKGGGLRGD
jgi:hypothetical protein